MSINRIFKRKEKEEGLREGFERGSNQAANEYTEADAKRKPGESLQEAFERLRNERANDDRCT